MGNSRVVQQVCVTSKQLNSFELARKLLSARGGFVATRSQAVLFYWDRLVVPHLRVEAEALRTKLTAKRGEGQKSEGSVRGGVAEHGFTPEGDNPNIRRDGTGGLE